MDDLVAAQRAVEAARRRLQSSVTNARTQRRTWADIGETLGMTRQAAFKRFGTPTAPSATGDGRAVARRSVAHVVEVTEQALQLLAAGEHDKLHGLMHERTALELPSELLGQTWARALAEVGELEGFEGTHVELTDGTTLEPTDDVLGTVIGATVLECEAGDLAGRVAVDDRLQVVGMLIAPTGHSPLPS